MFSVATQSSWKNASGGYNSRTEWHRGVAWGSLSQFAAKREKGAHVQVEGELRYREYEREYGTKKAPPPIKHRVAQILAHHYALNRVDVAVDSQRLRHQPSCSSKSVLQVGLG